MSLKQQLQEIQRLAHAVESALPDDDNTDLQLQLQQTNEALSAAEKRAADAVGRCQQMQEKQGQVEKLHQILVKEFELHKSEERFRCKKSDEETEKRLIMQFAQTISANELKIAELMTERNGKAAQVLQLLAKVDELNLVVQNSKDIHIKGKEQEVELTQWLKEEFETWCSVERTAEGKKPKGLMDITLVSKDNITIRIESKNVTAKLPKKEIDTFITGIRSSHPDVAILFSKGKIDSDSIYCQCPNEENSFVFKISNNSLVDLRRAIYTGHTLALSLKKAAKPGETCVSCVGLHEYGEKLEGLILDTANDLHTFLHQAGGLTNKVADMWRTVKKYSADIPFMTSGRRLAIENAKPRFIQINSKITVEKVKNKKRKTSSAVSKAFDKYVPETFEQPEVVEQADPPELEKFSLIDD